MKWKLPSIICVLKFLSIVTLSNNLREESLRMQRKQRKKLRNNAAALVRVPCLAPLICSLMDKNCCLHLFSLGISQISYAFPSTEFHLLPFPGKHSSLLLFIQTPPILRGQLNHKSGGMFLPISPNSSKLGRVYGSMTDLSRVVDSSDINWKCKLLLKTLFKCRSCKIS